MLSFADSISKAVVINSAAEIFQHRKRLRFNESKCKLLIIAPKSFNTSSFKLTLNNTNLPITTNETYLGDKINSKGNNESIIQDRIKAGRGALAEILAITEHIISTTSNLLISSYLCLFKSVFISKLLSNCQTWTKLTKQDINYLEKCTNTTLKRFLNVPISTPNCSLYLELGLLPIRYEIYLRKLTFLKKIISKKDSDIVKKIYVLQKNNNDINWYSEILLIMKEIEIHLNDTEIKEMSTSQWKSLIMKKVTKHAFNYLLHEKESKKKLNNLNYTEKQWECRSYFKTFNCVQSQAIFRVRTFMVPIKSNFSSSNLIHLCKLCKTNNDSQQHLFICPYFKDKLNMNPYFEDGQLNASDVEKLINRVKLVESL